jgi:hypothetical protein
MRTRPTPAAAALPRLPPRARLARLSRLASLCLLAACAPDLREDFPFDGEAAPGRHVTHEEQEGGVVRTQVDASQKEVSIYLDLDAREELSAAQALEGQAWDLAFQRFKVTSNGGVSGPGEAAVAALPGADFAALTRAPAPDTFQRDAADGPDANGEVDSAFLLEDGWYRYDLLQHKLSPRPVVYVVRTTRGRFFKLELLGYYDAAGTAGVLTFRWAEVEPPAR